MHSRKRRIISQLSSGSESSGELETTTVRRSLSAEIECRYEARIEDERKRHREEIARLVCDRDAQQAALTDRLAAAESEAARLKHEVGRLREFAETISANADIETRSAREAQEAECEAAAQLSAARIAQRREPAQLELRSLKAAPLDPRLDELRQELTSLRAKYKSLKETHEKLQAQILPRGVEEGRRLLDGASRSLVATNSLAHELSQMSKHEIECRYEARIEDERKRHREEIARLVCDRDAQQAALTDRLAAAESEAARRKHEVLALQQMVVSQIDTAAGRYTYATADNAALQERVLMLDEQIKEIEHRCEARLASQEKRHREEIVRLVRDRDAQQSALADRLAAAETEASRFKHEVGRLQEFAKTISANADIETRSARKAQEAEFEAAAQLSAARVAQQREREAAETVRAQLAAAQLELRSLKAAPLDPRLDELRQELTSLRAKYKSLKETHEKLQAQILPRGVEEGRRLLDGASRSLVATNSLAHELSQMSKHELQKALKEQQDETLRLKDYIDRILLKIVENYPQLLEV